MARERNPSLRAVPPLGTAQSYRGQVDAELRITLPGAEGSADARRTFHVFSRIAELLGALDRARHEGSGRTTWAISHLSRSSSQVGLVVGRPRDGLTVADAEGELRLLFDGFSYAQERDGAPSDWPQQAVKIGAEIGRYLGATPEEGMLLTFADNGQEPRRVTVTRVAADHLSTALRTRQSSIGSLIGKIEEINTHEGRNTAKLWLTHPRCYVEVVFRDRDMERVRDALTRRVMVAGLLERSSTGQPLKIRMRDLTLLPGVEESPPLTSFAGADPDFTGGVDPVEYVRDLRGTA